MKRIVIKGLIIILISIALFLLFNSLILMKPGDMKHLRRDSGIALKEKNVLQTNSVIHDYGEGIHGDGLLYLELRLDDQYHGEFLRWEPFPLSKEAESLIGIYLGDLRLPSLENAYWKLTDRSPKNWKGEIPSNASLLVYDADTRTLYWICYDI